MDSRSLAQNRLKVIPIQTGHASRPRSGSEIDRQVARSVLERFRGMTDALQLAPQGPSPTASRASNPWVAREDASGGFPYIPFDEFK